ncbi:MAG: hypothetical protein GC153_06690 [Alphaproteobacteria bacterium]|nr:hypothetical protein [Alphaproteobacteria bacterium]
MRVVTCLFALGFLAASTAARAGEEVKCADQYDLEAHLILEWAAIGGDPHAQYAIGQCAYPDHHGELTQAEKIYALKWLMLGVCDASDTPVAIHRDKLTRRLKENGDLSFRRFGGVTGKEKWTHREKRFQEYRREQDAKLRRRFEAISAETTEQDRLTARDALSDELSRMGPLGLLRLAEMTSCPSLDADAAFAAAAWQAADEAFKSSSMSAVYGSAARDIAKESETRLAALSPQERISAAFDKERLLKTSPGSMAQLENWAALGRLDKLASFGDANGAPERSLTTAIQYGLEAMGWLTFVNGPDNDYGPATIEAAQKAQAYYGDQQTRWLSHGEVRRLLCDAALTKSDPISYYHLALMYAQGWGFPQDLARARFALGRAEKLIDARLAEKTALPDWKQRAYPGFKKEISQAKLSIEAAWSALPADMKLAGEGMNAENLCR